MMVEEVGNNMNATEHAGDVTSHTMQASLPPSSICSGHDEIFMGCGDLHCAASRLVDVQGSAHSNNKAPTDLDGHHACLLRDADAGVAACEADAVHCWVRLHTSEGFIRH